MQNIRVETNGRFKSTKVYVNNNEIKCKALNISGTDDTNLDIVLTLALSTITQAQLRQEGESDRIGFSIPEEYNEDDEYED